ncbi:MAG: hypothetical protein GX096_02160 [Clostridiales bacterium]|nr:hypothetical protein [Clostridiales bacterium]
MTRFLKYAVEHDRKIRMMLMLEGVMLQKTVRVIEYDDQNVTLLIGAKKIPETIPMGDILSCDYARGDHGEE